MFSTSLQPPTLKAVRFLEYSFDIEKCLAQLQRGTSDVAANLNIPLILKSVQHGNTSPSLDSTFGLEYSFDIEKCLARCQMGNGGDIQSLNIPLILKSVQHIT